MNPVSAQINSSNATVVALVSVRPSPYYLLSLLRLLPCGA